MGSRSSNSNSNSKAIAVGECIYSSNSCSTTLTKSITKKHAKRIEQRAEQKVRSYAIDVYTLEKQQQLAQQTNKSEQRQGIKAKTTIKKVTPYHDPEEEEEKQQQNPQEQGRKPQRVAIVKNNNINYYHIKFFIILNIISNVIVIAVYVLLLPLIFNTFVKMVTWRGSIVAHSSKRSSSRRRANKNLNKNNTTDMYNISAISDSNASENRSSSNSNSNSGSNTAHGYFENNNNKSSNNFSTQTSRAIMSVATTIASTSASMAIANIPTSLLPPTSTPADIRIMTAEGIENNWRLDSGSSWAAMNQSSTNKVVDLIEMNLANETLSTIYPALRHYHGDYDVSYIARINPFWLQFEPPSTRTYYVMAILYCIISTIGCVGNSLVIFMFLRCKSLRTPANTLVINLAVSDLLMLLKCPIAIYNNFKEGPALGDAACRIYGFVGGLSGTASIGTLTAIALDRYHVVVHPLDPLRKTVRVRSAYVISMIWMYSFAFSIVPALDIGLSVYVPEGFLTTCSFDYLDRSLGARIFMFSFFVAAWCVPFSIICYSYFYILKVVYAANRIQSSKDKNKTEQKLALIVVGIIGLWFLAWTPYSVVAMMGVFGFEKYLTPLGSMIPALFCKTAACVDPYFYAATHPRFRMEFRRLWLGHGYLRRTSTTRSSYLTRSSTRRLRVISDVDMRNRSSENTKKNILQALKEVTEENDEDYEFSIPGNFSDGIIEQSRF